jgi:hypothetical protein
MTLTQGEWNRLCEMTPMEPGELPSAWVERLQALAAAKVRAAKPEAPRLPYADPEPQAPREPGADDE